MNLAQMTSYTEEPATYAWVIDKDHLDDGDGDKGTQGPHNAPEELLTILGEPKWPNHYGTLPEHVRRFRLYDDDGILYYSGRQYVPADADEDAEFGPLNDYGTPNAGAVDLRFFENGEWKSL